MHRKLHPFPDLSAWGPDDELIGRRELAALLQVPAETVKNWDRAGLMPPRAPAPPEGVLKGLPRVLCRIGDLREWVLRMVGEVFKRPSRPKGRRWEWIAGRGWVELPPVGRAPPLARTRPRRSVKIPGQHAVLLSRLEAQLAALDRLETPEVLDEPRQEPVEEPRSWQAHREKPEPQPFTSNIRRPTQPREVLGMTRLFRVVEAETGAELDHAGLEQIALHEPLAKGLIACDMEGFAIEEDGTLILLDECGSHRYPPEGRFRVEWQLPQDLVDSVLNLMQARGLMVDERDARAVVEHVRERLTFG